MNRIALNVALCALLAAPVAIADELYGESSLALGRLFMTPDERQRLDEERATAGTRSSPGADDAPTDAEESEAAPPTVVGLIVARGRQPLVWVDGEFRPVSSSQSADAAASGADAPE